MPVAAPISVLTSAPLVSAAFVIFSLVTYIFTRTRKPRLPRCRASSSPEKVSSPETRPDRLAIHPLNDFDWRTQEPRKLRPFKKTYHITMAIQSDTPSDLITIDRDYLDRVSLRRALIQRHGSTVHGCVPAGEAAVAEVYAYLFTSYLPTRYPTVFSTSPSSSSSSPSLTSSSSPPVLLHNAATGLSLPAQPSPCPLENLRRVGETVEEDMFILQPTDEGHRAVAFVCCFPAGFDGSQKLGRLLREIHAPVPGYGKIGASMERFFARLEVGRSVKRTNWSIQLDDELFRWQPHDTGLDDKHAADDTAAKASDASNGLLRVELQTLTRLPRTRSVLFSFKTYLYPLRDVRAEGLGPDLADAVDGLDGGNCPGMWTYKGSRHWAAAACEYLRS
ncbi:hypothetical protein N3K66_000207 [Trichothecium roseum]|uniref:Uncharacterized protein n=1 Tax=Trichothecium roseum TaxID=47278 RepID=A0ACC0VD30_9HYPO|nr:hypothetical protein N3K66_000207 [Trichothecium roseum]